ncbi:MAG: hypothetical protein WCG92_11835 [Hyphomicrobiales bacterium]
MPYLVRAEIEKPGTGTFKTEAETKCDAPMKDQRADGFRVIITCPKGEPVDATK